MIRGSISWHGDADKNVPFVGGASQYMTDNGNVRMMFTGMQPNRAERRFESRNVQHRTGNRKTTRTNGAQYIPTVREEFKERFTLGARGAMCAALHESNPNLEIHFRQRSSAKHINESGQTQHDAPVLQVAQAMIDLGHKEAFLKYCYMKKVIHAPLHLV